MTQTGTSNAIVNAMLSWLKGLAGWVLRLFNLSRGFSPLKFLADSWLELLVFLLIVGMAADLIIWLIRWRPHWVWFRRKRVIINDKNFFAGENELDDEDDWDRPGEYGALDRDDRRRRNWRDDEFVVAGAARKRREERARQEAMLRKARAAHVKSLQVGAEASSEPTDVFRDGLFNVNAKQKFSDRYEDEVFSVNNLPRPEAGAQRQPSARKRPDALRGNRRGAARPADPRRRTANKR